VTPRGWFALESPPEEEGEMISNQPIRAAQYLRMSTDLQEYSTANQAAAIRQYADNHGFVIVRKYEDAGRSGVVLRNRAGLKSLLSDVVNSQSDYEAILVYDVSRWGRFQDCDEAAHYEFLCRHAGIPVHYCAEPFANDGTMPNSVVKALKRAMAAEYSRELGVKCFAGQKRLAEMGFRVGGEAGYGFRRMMVSADSRRQRKLEAGQYKSLTTDRVTLVPGPPKEVNVIRQIFRMALRMRFADVVRELNSRGLPNPNGKPWTNSHVYDILKNPKYAGCSAWARTTAKLRGRVRELNHDAWVLCPGAFKPIISQHLFDAVHAAHVKRNTKMSDKQLLDKLKRLLAKKGKLTEDMMRRSNGVPSLSTYVRRFGSVWRAYQLVGYRPSRRATLTSQSFGRLKRRQDALVSMIAESFLGQAQRCVLHGGRPAIRLDTGATVSVLVCKHYKIATERAVRWELRPVRAERGLVTLVALLDGDNCGFHGYCIMQGMDKTAEYQIKGESDPWLRSGVRLRGLGQLYRVVTEMMAEAVQAS
jgi:DNA invertase Pin-like site-specific DNA recombinase